MCSNNFKIDCPIEKNVVSIKGLRTEIIVDKEVSQILDSLQKYDIQVLRYEPLNNSDIYKCTIEYFPGNICECCVFSFAFRFNHARHNLKKKLISAGGFITQEGQIPEIIHFKGMRDIDVYFALTDYNLIIDAQFSPLEKRIYEGEFPDEKTLEALIEGSSLKYLLQEYI